MPIYPAPQRFRDEAHINEARYEEMYERSVRDPDGFWSEQATAFLDLELALLRGVLARLRQRSCALVRRWDAERLHQLRRPASAGTR